MSYIAKGRYIDSTNRNGTFEVEVPSQDRRHIEKVVMSRYVAKKVIVNHVAPSPSMLAQQHADRVRQLDEERRQKAQTPSSGFSHATGPAHSHAHPPQQRNSPIGLLPLIGLGIIAAIFAGGGEDKTSAPGPMQIAPAIPSEGGSINDLVSQQPNVVIPAPMPSVPVRPSQIQPVTPLAPIFETETEGFIDIRDQRRNGRDR